MVQAAIVVALIKGLAAAGLIADPFPAPVAYNVPLSPPASPQPTASPSGDEAAGTAAPEAARARPKEVSAPKSISIKARPAPPVSATGNENRSGAGQTGSGTGGGGEGSGTGSGGSGDGSGAGGARKAEKIAGDIRSARDYPKEGRDERLGRSVVIAVTVGADGRPKGCQIARPSGNAEADRITCRLAMERFRFRPATDGNGQPVESVYGWEQRWFTP